MADEPQKEISGDLATREQAKRDQTQPVPLSLTIQYDPSKTTPPPGEPQLPAAPTGAGAGEQPAQPEAAQSAAPPTPAEGQAQPAANDAKLAFEQLIKNFLKDVGVTQPLGEKGMLEQAVGSPGQTTGDVTDLIRRVARGLDLGLQVAQAPIVGAGTLAGRLTEQAAPLPYQAAAAAGVPVPEALTTVQPGGFASRAVKEFTTMLGGMVMGPGAVIGPAAKQSAKRAAESGRSLALKGEVRAAMTSEQGAFRIESPARMTAGAINKELDKLDKQSTSVTDKLIAAGRSSEKPTETRKLNDPIAQEYKAVADRQSALRAEIEARYGPNPPARLPVGKGFGARERTPVIEELASERGSITAPGPSEPGMRAPIPPKPTKRKTPLRAATKEEAEMALESDASTLQVGDKLMAIQWGDMVDDQAIADTVKKLRSLYTEKHTIPIEETQRLAAQLREAGFEDSVVKRALLDGKTRAEAQALMDISKKGIERANELRDMLRDVAPETPAYQQTFQEFQVQLGISGKYIQLLDDIVGEAGGTMRIAQEAAQKIGGKRMDWMRDYAEKVSKGLISDLEKLPELWDALPREEQKWQFTRLASKHGWDIMRELAYDSMLFTFKGQMANMMGNTIQLKRPVDLTLASGIGTLRHAITRGEPALPLYQAAASGQGMIAAMAEAHWAAWDTFLTGQSRFGEEFKSVQRAISGGRVAETLAAKNITLADPISKAIDVAGFTMGLGNRALGGGDEWFKMVHYSARSFELAAEHAAKMGATGADIKIQMRQFLKFMPDEAKREAVEYAHYATYTEPLSGGLRQMHKVADSPALVGFIPFFKTLANVVKVGFEHLPGLNFLVKRSREAILSEGGTKGDLAWAKVAEGSALAVIGSWLYDAGKLTGREVDNKAINQIQKDMGWQPDAWAFYDDEGNPTGYMSINRLDPANQAFILTARTYDLMSTMGAESISWDTKDELAVALALALGEYTQEISFMRGVKDAWETFTVDTVREAEKRGKYLARRVASLAVPSGVGQIAGSMDPFMREAATMTDMICARTPECSTGLYPQRKLNGEPRMRLQAIGPKWLEFASPLPYSKANPDPVSSTMVANNMSVSFPSRIIMGRKPSELEPPNAAKDGFRLTDAQWDLYQRLAGNELKVPIQEMEGLIKALGYEGPLPKGGGKYGAWDILTALVQTDFYKNQLTDGSPSGKEKVVLGVISHFRTAAIGEMVLREEEWLGAKYDPANDFQTKFLGKKLSHAEAMGGPQIRRMAEDALRQIPAGVMGKTPPRFPTRDLPATLGR